MSNFDSLEWQKTQKAQYCVLSLMSYDILKPPISLVVLKSAFSLGDWILDGKHLLLSYENLDMVICLKDWYDVEDRQ